MRKLAYCCLLLAAFAAACSHGGGSGLPPGATPQLLTPKSVSPATISAPPMVHTAILPASAMRSPITSQMPVSSLNWTQVSGTATVVAAAPDGSLWALSNQPAGSDKFIWHYASGAWTNISGMASQIAVAQDGSLWAINSSGGIYQYSNGTWGQPTGGGASGSITADSSGGIEVLTNGGSGSDKAIWRWTSGSGWVQQAGSGIALAANLDTKSYTPGAGGSGTINSGGFYILNSAGGIYYENTDKSFAQLPGSASGIAPTTNGGVFVLGFPSAAGGNQIYYYDLDNPGWTTESGSGLTSISANTSVYVVSPSNAIYSAPLPSNVPAYCSAYSTPVPNANSSPQPVYITDNSNTGARVVLYLVTGAPPAPPNGPGGLQTQYLQPNGTLANFTPGATAAPFPLECFPGSTNHGQGLTFELPPPTNALQSANLFIVLATPPPGGGIANPITFKGNTGGGNSAPTFDWNTPDYVTNPWDVIEYTLPHGITDVTQVDKVGLPLQVSQGSTTIGFASGQYEKLLNDILADPIYKNLAVSAQLNGRNVLARILSPSKGENWGMPQDWWYNSSFSGSYSAINKGYIGYVLKQYQATPQLYTLNGVNDGQSGNYCVTFDGSTSVMFYSVGSATNCSSLTGSPTLMGIQKTLMGTVQPNGQDNTDSYGVCQSALFEMPYGSAADAGGQLSSKTVFYLWKAMVIDISRGVALQSGMHPIGGWDTSPNPPVPLSSFYLDPMFSKYGYLVHKYMIGNRSYVAQYDEPGGLAPTFTSDPAQPMQVTIWNIPTYSRATPTVTATPLPCPS